MLNNTSISLHFSLFILFTFYGGKSMGEIVELVKRIKEGEKKEFVVLVNKFEPLIRKYVYYLYKDEKEDVRAEPTCSVWEAIREIRYFENEGQVIAFFQHALKNKYLELYRNSCKKNDHEINVEESIMDIEFIENQYIDVMIKEDVERFLKDYDGNKRKIYFSIMVENLSDAEIAIKYNMSRQYVNRIRKELGKILLNQDFIRL